MGTGSLIATATARAASCRRKKRNIFADSQLVVGRGGSTYSAVRRRASRSLEAKKTPLRAIVVRAGEQTLDCELVVVGLRVELYDDVFAYEECEHIPENGGVNRDCTKSSPLYFSCSRGREQTNRGQFWNYYEFPDVTPRLPISQ